MQARVGVGVGLGAAVIGLGVLTPGTAYAEGVLDASVRLDSAAPAPGDRIEGIRNVAGTAEAPERIKQISLYVLPAGTDLSDSDAAPVATMVPDAHLLETDFSLDWDASSTELDRVDLVVVATTVSERNSSAMVPDLRVVHPAVKVVEKVKTTAKAAAETAAKSAPSVAAPSAPQAAAGAVVSSTKPRGKTVAIAAPVVAPGVSKGQSEAFYAQFGRLDYGTEAAAVADESVVVSDSLVRNASETGRAVWPSVAAGMVLVLTAAHVQRAVRYQLRLSPVPA